MSRIHYCKECGTNVVAGRNYVCGQCRLEDAAWNANEVLSPSIEINENRALARESIRGDRKARKDLVTKVGEEGADRVEKSVRDSAAGPETLFQRLSRGRR